MWLLSAPFEWKEDADSLMEFFEKNRIPKANTFKPVSKIVCRPFTASVSFGVRPVQRLRITQKIALYGRFHVY